MFENVSVEEALKRGQRTINTPVAIIMIGSIGICTYLGVQNIIPGWIATIAGIIGFLSAWIYWSFAELKWKVWAFENVRNRHELETRAIEAKLIWPEGSFWNKTEIWTTVDKQKWTALQDKFVQKDFFEDDYTIGPETAIYYSRGIILFNMLMSLLAFGLGVYCFIHNNYIGVAITVAAGLWLGYSEYRKYKNRAPQIILNSKGVETPAAGFNAWSAIYDDKVITESSGRSSTTYFEFLHSSGSERISIEELDITKKALQNLLHVYRARSEKH